MDYPRRTTVLKKLRQLIYTNEENPDIFSPKSWGKATGLCNFYIENNCLTKKQVSMLEEIHIKITKICAEYGIKIEDY